MSVLVRKEKDPHTFGFPGLLLKGVCLRTCYTVRKRRKRNSRSLSPWHDRRRWRHKIIHIYSNDFLFSFFPSATTRSKGALLFIRFFFFLNRNYLFLVMMQSVGLVSVRRCHFFCRCVFLLLVCRWKGGGFFPPE